MTTHRLEGQHIGGRGRLVDYSNLVKLPHTIFALPFALVGATLASYHHRVDPWDVLLILAAFTSARFAAMGFNRIVDRAIDARNPRTQMREIPAGKLSVGEATAAVVAASAVFIFCAAMLNRVCLVLAPFALGWILFYSYTKRFTRFAHLVLGLALAIAPVGAYLAVAGEWSRPPAALLVLAGGVLCWVAGFDILYSLQDIDFDRSQGLHSIPAALGLKGALAFSRVLHLLSAAQFVSLGFLLPELGAAYFTGTAIIAGMLLYEQSLVKSDDLSKIDAAFFNINGAISVVFFLIVLGERLFA
ncbi:UbiA-like polyprenyltransferase [Longimicrobium sp.]|uniref:UbiA-like polyprenyltransferase n=1 Tax=Longimicrobium sp. TaxID=2029185 RepID=UPI002E34D877|nr:UbiA-like polyprenyltransferase [Longimicrobium sp.]HEX6038751.1 UbiA-like polyprenyltransferase [Longimicrobium sp.]